MPDHTDPSSPTPPWMSLEGETITPPAWVDHVNQHCREIDDLELLNRIGFTRPEDQTEILSFARERDLPISALLRVALRDYQLRHHALFQQLKEGKPFGCPSLD